MSYLGAFSIENGDVISFEIDGKQVSEFKVSGFSFDNQNWGHEPEILICGTQMSDLFSAPGKLKETSFRYVVKNISQLRLVSKNKN